MKTNVRVINRSITDPVMQARVNLLRGKVEQVLNYRTTISRLSGGEESADPRRDIARECGHPKTEEITLENYQDLYDRNPIAKKANDIHSNHCWKVHPTVFEDEDPEKETEFEKAVADLGQNLHGESHYKDDEGSPFWEYVKRADRLCGIGHYGTILLGVGGAEGEDLAQPLTLKGNTQRELIYVRVFTERLSPIKQYDQKSSSPRYGLPEMYQMEFDDAVDVQSRADARVLHGSQAVHWSRVIHVTDELASNEVLHVPRLRTSYNRYLDLDKLYGGSAEMYWKGAFPGFHFGTHPQLGGDVEVDTDSMKSMIEEWLNGLQRSVVTSGYAVDSLSPQVVDPTAQIDAHLEAVCLEKDCPKRIFLGSERGELASSQDKGEWNEVVDARRNNHLTPRLIVPVIDRLILIGVLPIPPQGYGVKWPEIDTMSPADKAKTALLLTQAIAAFIASDGDAVLPLASFLTLVLGFSPKEARSIMGTLEEEAEEDTLRQEVATTDEERQFERQQQAAAEAHQRTLEVQKAKPKGLEDVGRRPKA
jgi:hypothetical protein